MITALVCNYPGVSSLAHSDFTRLLVHWFLEPNLHHKKMAQLTSESPSLVAVVSTFTLSPDCHLHRQVSALMALTLQHQWCKWCIVDLVTKCLYRAGHCITLARSVPSSEPDYCVHFLPVHSVQSPSTLSATVLVNKWHYHCPRVSSHYFIAFHFVSILF